MIVIPPFARTTPDVIVCEFHEQSMHVPITLGMRAKAGDVLTLVKSGAGQCFKNFIMKRGRISPIDIRMCTTVRYSHQVHLSLQWSCRSAMCAYRGGMRGRSWHVLGGAACMSDDDGRLMSAGVLTRAACTGHYGRVLVKTSPPSLISGPLIHPSFFVRAPQNAFHRLQVSVGVACMSFVRP
ncbi:hypothetical protein BKA93DRAFT_478559 [Sparassis latifolia]